jgi:hypothetical protein
MLVWSGGGVEKNYASTSMNALAHVSIYESVLVHAVRMREVGGAYVSVCAACGCGGDEA